MEVHMNFYTVLSHNIIILHREDQDTLIILYTRKTLVCKILAHEQNLM